MGRARPTWALISGGGTGGHVIPALAIAHALLDAGHPAGTIHFVGSSRGMEATMVPEAGFEVTLLPGRGIARSLSAANVAALAGLAAAVARAVVLVGRRRPAVVVSVGGYASVAGVIGAVIWRVPVVVVEQNAVPGAANRLAGRFARAAAVAWPGTDLPRAVVTGNPIRPELAALDRSGPGRRAARLALDLPPEGVVVAVTGGSLGSGRINAAVTEVARSWQGRLPGAEPADIAFYHVVGQRDAGRLGLGDRDSAAGGDRYRQVPFESRMDLLYRAADLVVARAGATTVAELAAAGLASVLVPLPRSPGDHQGANARRMAGAGAAVVVPDSELDAHRLANEILGLAADPGRLSAMGTAASQVAAPRAAAEVAALVEAHARH